MLFTKPELTSGFRPSLQEDEEILIVQDDVGLYEGKFKVAQCQKGHAYLSTHCLYYVDDVQPRSNSVALELRDIERHEFQAGFLRSSAKVILYPKPPRHPSLTNDVIGTYQSSFQGQHHVSVSSPTTRTSSPARPIPYRPSPLAKGSWICPICSYSNPVPSNFDPRTATQAFPLPPCLTCGVKPPYAVVLKAAINANSTQSRTSAERPVSMGAVLPPGPIAPSLSQGDALTVICPRCTFENHPSLRVCELCGSALPASVINGANAIGHSVHRTDSPGPVTTSLQLNDEIIRDGVRVSFRSGGDKIFYEQLKQAMIQRKWLLETAPPIPQKSLFTVETQDNADGTFSTDRPRSTPVGIAGLEQRGLQTRRKNETAIGTAFEDLETLMASAKEIVALAQKFSDELGSLGATGEENALLSQSTAAIGIVATKDKVGDRSTSLYISELSRNLAEYITDDRRAILTAQGGVMSLVDLWALFNRSRDGVELISPSDFHSAVTMWDELKMPVKLRQFRSGLLVVQRRTWTDERLLDHINQWLQSTKRTPLSLDVLWEWTSFGSGVTAQDAAVHFGWSIGVASEELEMAEERGLLCREESVEGLRFWLNHLVQE